MTVALEKRNVNWLIKHFRSFFLILGSSFNTDGFIHVRCWQRRRVSVEQLFVSNNATLYGIVACRENT